MPGIFGGEYATELRNASPGRSQVTTASWLSRLSFVVLKAFGPPEAGRGAVAGGNVAGPVLWRCAHSRARDRASESDQAEDSAGSIISSSKP